MTSDLFLAGSFAGIANSILSGPIEHVRTRLQIQSAGTKIYNGPVDFFKKVYSTHGLAGVFKGQGITMVREFIGYGVYFSTYETLINREMKQKSIARSQVSTWKQVLFGALSGYTLWLVIYPIDFVKSKIQTDAFVKKDRMYTSSMDVVKKTFAKDGIKGFFRGFLACMLRCGPVNGLTFAAFEVTMNVIGRD